MKHHIRSTIARGIAAKAAQWRASLSGLFLAQNSHSAAASAGQSPGPCQPPQAMKTPPAPICPEASASGSTPPGATADDYRQARDEWDSLPPIPGVDASRRLTRHQAHQRP